MKNGNGNAEIKNLIYQKPIDVYQIKRNKMLRDI